MNPKLFWLFTAILLVFIPRAEAQQPTQVPRVGFLNGGWASGSPERRDAFRQGLRDLGYVEGKNIVIEYRYAEDKPERPPWLMS